MALPIPAEQATKLKIYRCTISDDIDSPMEVQAVALVDQPAIEKNFMAFRAQESRTMNFVLDAPRQIISGPAMLADTPIYRRDEADGKVEEYFVTFDKATIEKIAQKFFAKGFNSNFNIMHDPAQQQEGVCIYQSFISDSTMGIQPMTGYEDAPEGSWFISAKVNNPDVWAKIASGAVKGFSVEGVFKLIPPEQTKLTPEQTATKMKEILALGELTDEARIELIEAIFE